VGADFHGTDRGGDVTFHGPGQVVGYPILICVVADVHAYLRALEEAFLALIDSASCRPRAATPSGIPRQVMPSEFGFRDGSRPTVSRSTCH
jgi:lipoate-protein ligase B